MPRFRHQCCDTSLQIMSAAAIHLHADSLFLLIAIAALSRSDSIIILLRSFNQVVLTATFSHALRAGRRKLLRASLAMIEVICNDRLGKKIRVKCNPDDTVGDLKKLLAAQTGTRPEKLRIQKWYTVYKDHITLEDYEIHDGMGLELYYN
eukprot:1425846-Pleurochrysis_carterae.AAC.6